MKRSLLLSIFLLLSSSLLVAPIHARNKPSAVATPAPAPSHSDCSSIIFSMMDCLSYLSLPSNDTAPTKTCCEAIETVLEYNPKCICVGLESSKDMGIALNNTRALAMPKTCKLPIAAPHCASLHHGSSSPSSSSPGASTPGASTPASPSAGTPMTSSPSAESPTTSPSSLSDTPTAPAPSKSGTNNLSVSVVTLFISVVSSIVCISAFSNY